jgi:catalase
MLLTQLEAKKRLMQEKHPSAMTTNFGQPVTDNQHSLTAGRSGPTLLQDVHLVEKLAHFDRERIPERVVHAKGAGAHGYFEVTHEVAPWTKAAFLNAVGKQTPTFVRFSTVKGELGSSDTVRDVRGFALKFYTEEGNYDLVGNNTPVFFIRDAIKFPDFVHSQKRHPQTNAKDANMAWDFLSHTPEAMLQITIVYSDLGTPKTYRHMDGFGSHTFQWVNATNQAFWIKYHFKTEAGIENWTREEALAMDGINPDYATLDLFQHIEAGNEAAWRLFVQIMPSEAARTSRFDPFDVTRIWPVEDYPLVPVGRLVLNRNPANYFAEVEQAAFAPANVVPGIGFSPDKLLQGRIFSYPDAQRYRLGTNYALIPVNQTSVPVCNYQRGGSMRVDANGGNGPNYEPNTSGGPSPTPHVAEYAQELSGTIQRAGHRSDDDYVQAGEYYRKLSKEEQARLIDNLVDSLKHVSRQVQLRQLPHFFGADREYGARVAAGLGLPNLAQAQANSR